MHLFVGSTNPVKINAVVTAASETWPDVAVLGYEVPSGIDEQPQSDEETRKGAQNRAKAALEKGFSEHGLIDQNVALGIGLEGGVFIDNQNMMWSTVWAVVYGVGGRFYESNGARFPVPPIVAEKIKTGEEMGPIVEKITGRTDIRQKQGMIGVITNGFVDRTEEYSGIAKMALGLWYGRHWDAALHR